MADPRPDLPPLPSIETGLCRNPFFGPYRYPTIRDKRRWRRIVEDAVWVHLPDDMERWLDDPAIRALSTRDAGEGER